MMEKNTKPRTKYNPKNFDTKSGFSDKKKFVKRPQPKGMAVNVYDDDVMKAWRILKRKVTNENLMGELRDRRYFMKPSEKLITRNILVICQLQLIPLLAETELLVI